MTPENGIYHNWVVLLNTLLQQPIVSPRGKPCREAIHTRLIIEDAYQNILIDPERKLNYRFLVAQWLTTQLGLEDKLLERFNKNLAGYETDGQGGVYPSYGPRLAPQWPFILGTLSRDPESRQAVMSIWEAQSDIKITAYERYVPCTLSLQFLLRRQSEWTSRNWYLHIIATMRSSDAWLGLPYDIYNFTMLGNFLVGALRHALRWPIALGSITLNLGSSHIYEPHWELARGIVNAPMGRSGRSPQLPTSLSLPAGINRLVDPSALGFELNDVWKIYEKVLASATNAEALAYLEDVRA